MCVCGGEAGEAASEAGDGGRLVQYYIKVMRLFEQVPSPSYAIRVAEGATNMINRDHPNAVSDLMGPLYNYAMVDISLTLHVRV